MRRVRLWRPATPRLRLAPTPTPPVSPGEALHEVHRAQPRERRRLRSHHPLRRAREMRGAGEVEHRGHVAYVVAWILRQLGRRDEAYEIDDALEVGRAARGEGAAEMLARDANGVGEKLRANRSSGPGHDASPCRLLQRRVERERRRRT